MNQVLMISLTILLAVVAGFPRTASTAAAKEYSRFVVKVAAGYDFTAVLMKDGKVWVWGKRFVGLMPNGEKTFTDPLLAPGLDDIVDIQAGAHHLLALKKDGTVWVKGSNQNGQRGNGTFEGYSNPIYRDLDKSMLSGSSPVPFQVPGLKGIIGIAATGLGGRAWNDDGQFWEWGDAIFKDASEETVNLNKPRLTPRIREDIQDVAGYSYGILVDAILKKDGTVAVLGRNDLGQWGDGSRVTVDEQIGHWTVVKEVHDVERIETPGIAGTVLAYRKDGKVLEWGGAATKQKGIKLTDYLINPFRAPANLRPVQTADLQGMRNVLMLGADHIGKPTLLGLKPDGSVMAWGDNSTGLLADGNTTERYTWAKVKGLPPIVQIAGSFLTGYAVGRDGSLWGWGSAVSLQFGNVPELIRTTPMPVGEFYGNAVRIKINDNFVTVLPNPEYQKGALAVNLKEAVEWFGATVSMDSNKKTAKVTRGKSTVSFTAGSVNAKVNGKTVKISFAPVTREGAWIVPAIDLATQLGGKASLSATDHILKVFFK